MADIQTGIALHQWERGKGARNILQAPEGFLLAEFDASGQEMRLMADDSQDETMLKLFLDGIDGHAYMGAQIENKEWQWVSGEQDKDPEAKRIRNLGKFCIAEGELVLTDRGPVPIEKVQLTDKVWDGVEWVSHTGAVYQGKKMSSHTKDLLPLQTTSSGSITVYPADFKKLHPRGFKSLHPAMIGKRFGSWELLTSTIERKKKSIYCECKCDCGAVVKVALHNLLGESRGAARVAPW